VRALLTGTTLAVLILGAGCGTSGEEATPPTTTTSSVLLPPTGVPSANPTPPDLVPVAVTISGGQVEPPPARVDVPQGHTVLITVTSDEHDELHVHGYDLDVELLPGESGPIEFVADRTGLFEVETHHSGLQLFQLAVQ
jgi:hypothetical protein